MITDDNGVKFFENSDKFDHYGARTWQENFKTVSALISDMRKRIEELEEKSNEQCK